jgi:hypothetical protein
MSWREHWPDVKSSVEPGDAITGCRDNDTRTYRLFVMKGYREVVIDGHGGRVGYQFDSCECCDLSLEDLRALSAVLERAIATHQPWLETDDE